MRWNKVEQAPLASGINQLWESGNGEKVFDA